MFLLFVNHLIWSHLGMYCADITTVYGMAAKQKTYDSSFSPFHAHCLVNVGCCIMQSWQPLQCRWFQTNRRKAKTACLRKEQQACLMASPRRGMIQELIWVYFLFPQLINLFIVRPLMRHRKIQWHMYMLDFQVAFPKPAPTGALCSFCPGHVSGLLLPCLVSL